MDFNKIISSFVQILHNIQCDCNIPIANVLCSKSAHIFNKPIDDYISNWEQEESDIYETTIKKYLNNSVKPTQIVNLHQVKFSKFVKPDQVLLRLLYYNEMYKCYNKYTKHDLYGLNNISQYVNHLNQII